VTPAAVVLPDGSRFHHIGVACRDLADEQAGMRALGYEPVGAPFTDPRQGISGVFVEGTGPRLELLAPLEGSAVLDPWLRGGSRMYHLAYEVADLDGAVAAAVADGARLVSGPVAAVAFQQRRISFLMLQVRLLTELIELA
jgi:methylmalonyl-CoA/ethylmalonyl-CoA epimerase